MKRISGLLLLFMWCAPRGDALSQEPRYLPRLPESIERRSRLPQPDTDVTGDPTIIGKELKALIFVEHPDLVDPGPIRAEGIQVRGGYGVELLRDPEYQSIARGYLGGPISIRRLNALARDTILYYRRGDRPVVDVSVPEQDITDGVVQVVVNEARVGAVIVEGPCFFDPQRLADQTCISPGDAIYKSVLMEDLRYLNLNPYRRAEVRLRPGARFGETDVVFDVTDEKPISAYAGYEDSGTRNLGIERSIYGVSLGNVAGRDHQAGYQLTASSDFDTLLAHSGIYSMRLPNRDSLSVYGGYAEINTAVPPLDLNGFAWQTSFRYDREISPGACRPRDCREHHVTVGFDYKRTNTNLDQGGLQVFTSPADIAQIAIGYYGSYDENYNVYDEDFDPYFDSAAKAAWGADLYIGLDGFSTHNDDPSFQVVRADTRTDYVYTRMFYQRQWPLPHNLRFFGRITGQFSTRRLLPSEELNFTGYSAVRGYDMRAVNADNGLVVNTELRTKPISLGLENKDVPDELEFLSFFDYGNAQIRDAVAGEDPNVEVASVGIGLRYRLFRRVSVRTDYAWQLKDVPGTYPASSRWHVGVVVSR